MHGFFRVVALSGMSTSGNAAPGGGHGPSGPDRGDRGEQVVLIANVVVGVVGSVYTATQSLALALGGAALVWLVILGWRHQRDR